MSFRASQPNGTKTAGKIFTLQGVWGDPDVGEFAIFTSAAPLGEVDAMRGRLWRRGMCVWAGFGVAAVC